MVDRTTSSPVFPSRVLSRSPPKRSAVRTFEETPDGTRSWIAAGVGAVAMVFTFGTPLSYGILQGPVSGTLDVSPVAASTIFSAMLFTFFIGSGVVGVVTTRVSARLLLFACAAATAMIAPSLFVVESYAGLVVVFAILGLALGTAFIVVASVVPRWFDERRGAATGVIFVGNGLGLTMLPPAWQYAISTVGLREAFLVITSLTAVAFGLAAVFCGRPTWAEGTGGSLGDVFAWVRELIGTRRFQLLFVGMSLAFAWYQLLAAYAVGLFASRGLTETAASLTFGLIGGVSIVSRLGGGYVADRIGSRRAFLWSLALTSVGVAFLFAPQTSLLAVSVILVGLGLGGTATLYIPLLMETYDPRKDTAIVGIFNVAVGIGALAMPPLGTASVVITGGYTGAVLLTLVVVVAGFVTVVIGTR